MLHQIILASLFSVSLLIATAHTDVIYKPVVQDTATSTENVSESLVDANKAILRPELEKICACESGNGTPGSARQFYDDGTLVVGKIDPDDRGKCQVNMRYHGETAEKMGLDLDTEYGNTTYSNWLYEKQGTRPWRASSKCWGKAPDNTGDSSIMNLK